MELIVSRKKRMLGMAINFPVYLDGEKIGTLKNGSKVTAPITPGKHVVTIKSLEKKVEQGLIVKEDTKSVEIKATLKMGILAGRVVLEDIIYN